MLSLTNIFVAFFHETIPHPRSDNIHADLPPSWLFWTPTLWLCPSWWGGGTLDPLVHLRSVHDFCHAITFQRAPPLKIPPPVPLLGCDCPDSACEICDLPMVSNLGDLRRLPGHRLHWIPVSLQGLGSPDTLLLTWLGYLYIVPAMVHVSTCRIGRTNLRSESTNISPYCPPPRDSVAYPDNP